MAGANTPYEQLAGRLDIVWYEEALRVAPDNPGVMDALAQAYTCAGEYDKGLMLDRKLAQLRPNDPTVCYNFACSLSLTGATDEAIAALKKAVSLGYDEREHMMTDTDLTAVRAHPGFSEILAQLAQPRSEGTARKDRKPPTV